MNNDGVYTSPQNVLSGAEGYYYSSPNATPVVIQDQLSGFQFANGSYSSYVTGLSNTGEVAGYAQAPDATNKVFEYNVNTGTYTTLDTTALIAAGADPRTIETGGISSNGQYIAINYANAAFTTPCIIAG